jgi:hypothetical protein
VTLCGRVSTRDMGDHHGRKDGGREILVYLKLDAMMS